jgi:hypothetical protein
MRVLVTGSTSTSVGIAVGVCAAVALVAGMVNIGLHWNHYVRWRAALKEEGVFSSVWWVPWRPRAYVDEAQALLRLLRLEPEPRPGVEDERQAARRYLLLSLLLGALFAALIAIGFVIAR